MAQLSDDCFAFGGTLMQGAEALARIRTMDLPLPEIETVPLKQALGRIVAAPLVAARDVPPHDNAAVDGYAVHFADLGADAPTTLPVTGRAAAGHPLGPQRAPGRGDPHLHRRADAGRPRHGADAGGLPRKRGPRQPAARHQARRQPAPPRRGCARGRHCGRGRHARAAAGGGARRGARADRARGLPQAARGASFDRRRGARAGHQPAAGRHLRRQPLCALGAPRRAPVRGRRFRHRARPRRCRARGAGRGRHGARSRRHLGRHVGRRGRSRQGRGRGARAGCISGASP